MTQREAARAVAPEPTADTTPPTNEPSPSPGGPASRPDRRRIIGALAVLGVLAVAAAGYWLFFVRGIVSSDDARIAADLVDVSPQVGGTLETLQVGEGDSVEAGQVLFALDATTLGAALKRARAEVDAARARVAIARAGADKALHGPRAAEIRIAIAAKESTDAQARLAESEWKRAQALFEQKVVTEADLLRAQTQWERRR